MRYILLAAAIIAITTPGARAVTVSGHPVHVTKCDPELNATLTYPPAYYPASPFYWNDPWGYRYYQPPFRASNPTLSIDYSNSTTTAMSAIEFGLVANGRLVAEVRDVGTFSPGAEIKHSFGISHNVFPLQTGLPHCVPLWIRFADGTHWRNPNLPALRNSAFGPGI